MSLAETGHIEPRETRARNKNARTAAAQEGAQRRPDHLYVMKSADGLLKVGRSKRPRKRRVSLEAEFCVAIEIVAVLRKQGYLEQTVLADLAAYQAHGEWFQNAPEARSILEKWYGGPIKFPATIERSYEPRRHHGAWVDMALDNWLAKEEWKSRRKAEPDFADPPPVPLAMPRPRRPAG